MNTVLFYCPCNSLSKILLNKIGFINIGLLVKKKKLFSKYFLFIPLSRGFGVSHRFGTRQKHLESMFLRSIFNPRTTQVLS